MRVLHVLAERGYSGGEQQLEFLVRHLHERGHSNGLVLVPGAKFESVGRELDLPIFELEYEALVGDTESSLARVRAFLGLDPDASSSQAVAAEVFATASVWQARQRVHTRSLERWRNYADCLPELGDPRFD